MSADTITTEQLTAIKAYATESAACFVDEFPGEEHICEAEYLSYCDPDQVASGSDAEWTDASSAADALRRYLNNDMCL